VQLKKLLLEVSPTTFATFFSSFDFDVLLMTFFHDVDLKWSQRTNHRAEGLGESSLLSVLIAQAEIQTGTHIDLLLNTTTKRSANINSIK